MTEFYRGQRVKPSPSYPVRRPIIARTFGTVGTEDGWVRVKWDNLKNPEYLHPSFVEPVSSDDASSDGE